MHIRVLRLVLSGLMGALLVVSKQAMSGLPNIEPVTLLVILFALLPIRGRCTSVRPSKSNSTASRLPPSYFSLLKSTSVSSACFSAQTRRITASASGTPP